MEEKTHLSHPKLKLLCPTNDLTNVFAVQMLDFDTSNSNSEVSKIKFVENYFFLENYVTSEGAVSHNVLYCQQLSIACNKVSYYANKYFE